MEGGKFCLLNNINYVQIVNQEETRGLLMGDLRAGHFGALQMRITGSLGKSWQAMPAGVSVPYQTQYSSRN